MTRFGELLWIVAHVAPGGWAGLALGSIAGIVLVACAVIRSATAVVRSLRALFVAVAQCRLAWDELGALFPRARTRRSAAADTVDEHLD
jgi:hypothetical protein